MLKFDFHTYMDQYLSLEDKEAYNEKIESIKERITKGDLSYWLDTNSYISDKEIEDIESTSKYIKSNCDVFIVIGIGGSYMGAKAIIEALLPTYNKEKPEIIFMGTNLSSNEYSEILTYINDKEVIVNVISKSGTTLEPSIAFDLILEQLSAKYTEEELKRRIIITTDKEQGELRKLVNIKGYKSFIVPSNIGGRFSCLTPVGMLPISVAGININELINGAKTSAGNLSEIIEYSIIRDFLYYKERPIESFTIYNPKLTYFTEWLKQLFGETQGKENKGILPISNINTRDLHSLGQFIQDGNNIIFETVIGIEQETDVNVSNYTISLNELNKIALKQVAKAHLNGDTPSNIIMIDKLNENSLGELTQFFILSAIIGGLLLDINPFDQPGVQEYKKLITEELDRNIKVS